MEIAKFFIIIWAFCWLVSFPILWHHLSKLSKEILEIKRKLYKIEINKD